MAKRPESPPSRDWYKLATAVLSAALVVMTFIGTIYYRGVDTKGRRIEAVQDKIDGFLQHRVRVSAIPKVAVSLLTLEKSGLPTNAFSELKEMPAVVSITHAGGETARGISIRITSAWKILRFVPNSSVESFSSVVGEDGKSLEIEVEQLRRNSVVSGTLLCEGIGPLSVDVRVDQGQFVDDASDPTPKNLPRILAFEDIDKLEPTGFTSEKHIDAVLEKLRLLRAKERHPPRQKGNNSFQRFMDWGLFLAFAPILGVVPVILWASRDKKRRRRAQVNIANESKRLAKKIERHIEQGDLTIGMSAAEILQLLGNPRRRKTLQDSNSKETTWCYEPRVNKFTGSLPDLYITLRDEKIHRILYKEYPERGDAAEQKD
ncbi:MAG: hypothetical protein IH989_08310 [Planctomycetes bacterium]|nr:hypothetical protein [Planctomycetota bacterium]